MSQEIGHDCVKGGDGPSPWVVAASAHFAPGALVLDLACGGLRHARFLAGRGFRVLAVDRLPVPDASVFGPWRERIEYLQHDLEAREWPFARLRFGGVVVTHYLHRPLFPMISAALDSHGVLAYETFAQGNERFGRPARPEFLLRPGELLDVFAPDLTILAYEHGEVSQPRCAVTQRIVARRAGVGGA